ncbi:MAG: hypothetical protein DRQ65_05190 [Gammaproteobacteria bacterium]|nr:MAG: hypothetical protein DRQ65_05190 [Gammaproteobacteria bacterium]RLA55423.1 MAG: hypothetical protein DRQ98_05200 [Gammaproteobacteria bacterium]
MNAVCGLPILLTHTSEEMRLSGLILAMLLCVMPGIIQTAAKKIGLVDAGHGKVRLEIIAP